MDISQQLKPCPYCGYDKPHLSDEFGFYKVVCSACGASGPTSDVLDEDNTPAGLRTQAINRWNGITSETWEREFDEERLYKNKGVGEHVKEEADEDWIPLDDKWRDDVLKENKVTTIRKGERDYSVAPTVLKFENSRNIPVRIERIEIKQWKYFVTHDVKNEGFEEFSELQSALEEYYDIYSETVLTIVQFSVIDRGGDYYNE